MNIVMTHIFCFQSTTWESKPTHVMNYIELIWNDIGDYLKATVIHLKYTSAFKYE